MSRIPADGRDGRDAKAGGAGRVSRDERGRGRTGSRDDSGTGASLGRRWKPGRVRAGTGSRDEPRAEPKPEAGTCLGRDRSRDELGAGARAGARGGARAGAGRAPWGHALPSILRRRRYTPAREGILPSEYEPRSDS
ncbi:hypothetical protein GCM10022252_21020 [Streptosporangium oxazolinicum]|uniref:Uncharacterized protein n=1 Tax=Streptosporangium oxazolinicum TaxID=909287 RepID=A0ABP8AQ52_9ACTN